MADKTIGELKKATNLDDDSLLIAEQQGDAVSVTGALFKSFAQAATKGYAESASKDAATAVGAKDAAQSALQGVRDALDNLPEGDTLVINDLTTGGTSAALSAEMGKKLNENLSSHAAQHASAGSDPITPAAIGAAPAGFGLGTKAVDISGKNITEIAFGGKWGLYRGVNVIGCPYPDVWYTYEVFPSYGDGIQGYAGIIATDLNNGNLYTCAVTGTTITAWKQLATTDTALMKTDKPSGSYTGNSDATRRTIHTGGIDGTAIIYSANGVAIVTAAGAFRYSFSSGMLGVGVRFENGELIIISDDDTVNASGITYTYQVL